MSKQNNKQQPTDPEEVNPDIKKLEEDILNFKNMYLRALADYKNLENRVQQERGQMQDTIKKQIVMELLPVLDNLHQAEIFTKDTGLQMVSKSFQQALEHIGVKEVNVLGEEYDPYSAEVLEVINGKEDNMVVDVVQKGYSLNGEVIRPAKVKVSKVNS